jgi:hypothetical protein
MTRLLILFKTHARPEGYDFLDGFADGIKSRRKDCWSQSHYGYLRVGVMASGNIGRGRK